MARPLQLRYPPRAPAPGRSDFAASSCRGPGNLSTVGDGTEGTRGRRPMARQDKATAVEELAEEFRGSTGAVLTEYRGLTVSQLQELRRGLGDHATFHIVKNTLNKIAAKEADVESFEELLVGPSAIAFIKGDVVEATKGLRDFARTNSRLVIKGGVLDGRPLTLDEIDRLPAAAWRGGAGG